MDMDSRPAVSIGIQSFEKIRERNSFYVDKTGFIREWWEQGSDVTLITRPRRFGKTLNMSMLECFFSNRYAEKGGLFEGLSIWDEKYKALQGQYPVIYLSFASVKSAHFSGMKTAVKKIIFKEYLKYQEMMKSDQFSGKEKRNFDIVDFDMDDETAYTAINDLCAYLEKFYHKKTIILLDEYDTPMLEAWLAGYWDEAVVFMREFFNSTFKTNPYMERAVITGITRISKESIFSDLNNLDVVSVTSDKYAASFGFTESEVFAALDYMGLGAEKQGVKKWYDGFTFGNETGIYNPWSITSFISEKGKYGAYWSNTSGNGLVNSLIQKGDVKIKQITEELIKGGSFDARIDDQIIFDQLDGNPDAVWGLLLATGYLKIVNVGKLTPDSMENPLYTLALTNFEVRRMFHNMVEGWFSKNGTQTVYNEFIRAMLNDNVRKMNTFMNKVALNTFSSFDSGNKPSEQTEPERFYHGFVLGMVVNLADTYLVRSNRESGYGRYDVMLEPVNKTGKAFIFEFKVLDRDEDEETLEDTLAAAHRQIAEKKYETELVSRGFAPEKIRSYGFAFRGRECLIG